LSGCRPGLVWRSRPRGDRALDDGVITALRAVLPEDAREWVCVTTGPRCKDLSDTLVRNRVGPSRDIAERDVSGGGTGRFEIAGEYRARRCACGTTGRTASRSTFRVQGRRVGGGGHAEMDRHLEGCGRAGTAGRSCSSAGPLGNEGSSSGRPGPGSAGGVRTASSGWGCHVVPWLTAGTGCRVNRLLAAISATAGKLGPRGCVVPAAEAGDRGACGSRSPRATVGSNHHAAQGATGFYEHMVTLARVIGPRPAWSWDGM